MEWSAICLVIDGLVSLRCHQHIYAENDGQTKCPQCATHRNILTQFRSNWMSTQLLFKLAILC